MANTNQPQGFKIVNSSSREYIMRFNNVASGVSFKPGDPVYLDSNGYQTSTSGVILGIAVSGVLDTDGVPAASGGASNNYSVDVNTDPNILMVAQITTHAVADPYTCATRTACFDIAGSSGEKYIDAGASSLDDIIVIRLANEFDTGLPSVVGAYAKVFCMFNPARHLYAKNS